MSFFSTIRWSPLTSEKHEAVDFQGHVAHLRYKFLFQVFVWTCIFLTDACIFINIVVRKCKVVVLWLQKQHGNFYEGFYQTEVTTLAVNSNLLLAGAINGELIWRQLLFIFNLAFHLWHLQPLTMYLRNAVFGPWRNKLLLPVNTWWRRHY